MVLADDGTDSVNHVSRILRICDIAPVGPVFFSDNQTTDRSLDVLPEVPLDFGERADLHGGEVELEHKERVPEWRRVMADVGHAEQLVEAVFEIDVIVVREHRADDRLAEPLRPQEHGGLALLQLADVSRIVHEQAFTDNLGPVYDSIRDIALVRHDVKYTTSPAPCSRSRRDDMESLGNIPTLATFIER